MKKALILMLSLAMVATLAITGCNSSKKAMDTLAKDLCVPEKNVELMKEHMDTITTFMGHVMYDPELAKMMNEGKEMSEDDFVKKMQEEGKKNVDEDVPEFEECNVTAEAIDCAEAYKELAEVSMYKQMGGDKVEEKIAKAGEKMGIKNCGVLKASKKEKDKDKEEGKLFVGEIDGKVKIFAANMD